MVTYKGLDDLVPPLSVALLAAHGLGAVDLPSLILHFFLWPAVGVSLLRAIILMCESAKRDETS